MNIHPCKVKQTILAVSAVVYMLIPSAMVGRSISGAEYSPDLLKITIDSVYACYDLRCSKLMANDDGVPVNLLTKPAQLQYSKSKGIVSSISTLPLNKFMYGKKIVAFKFLILDSVTMSAAYQYPSGTTCQTVSKGTLRHGYLAYKPSPDDTQVDMTLAFPEPGSIPSFYSETGFDTWLPVLSNTQVPWQASDADRSKPATDQLPYYSKHAIDIKTLTGKNLYDLWHQQGIAKSSMPSEMTLGKLRLSHISNISLNGICSAKSDNGEYLFTDQELAQLMGVRRYDPYDLSFGGLKKGYIEGHCYHSTNVNGVLTYVSDQWASHSPETNAYMASGIVMNRLDRHPWFSPTSTVNHEQWPQLKKESGHIVSIYALQQPTIIQKGKVYDIKVKVKGLKRSARFSLDENIDDTGYVTEQLCYVYVSPPQIGYEFMESN
ncbi:MAG: hypothetical protein VXY77_03575 [Pseudomonadota bacterium]|nr:hypothetical protein [Pseudomonadota bacterium]